MAHGRCDGGAHAHGREHHYDARELEHRLGESLGDGEEGPAALVRQQGERDAEEDAEDDDLQHLPFGHRLGHVLGEDVEDRFGQRSSAAPAPAPPTDERRRLAHTHSGPSEVDGDEADHEGEGRHHLEVEESLDAHSADLLEVGVPRDAHHDRREDEWRQDRLDEPEEDLAEQAQRDRELRPIVADLGAGDHGDEDPGRERATARGQEHQSRHERPAPHEADRREARNGPDRTEKAPRDDQGHDGRGSARRSGSRVGRRWHRRASIREGD